MFWACLALSYSQPNPIPHHCMWCSFTDGSYAVSTSEEMDGLESQLDSGVSNFLGRLSGYYVSLQTQTSFMADISLRRKRGQWRFKNREIQYSMHFCCWVSPPPAHFLPRHPASCPEPSKPSPPHPQTVPCANLPGSTGTRLFGGCTQKNQPGHCQIGGHCQISQKWHAICDSSAAFTEAKANLCCCEWPMGLGCYLYPKKPAHD